MRVELRKIGSKERHRFEGRVIRFGIANNNFNPYNVSAQESPEFQLRDELGFTETLAFTLN